MKISLQVRFASIYICALNVILMLQGYLGIANHPCHKQEQLVLTYSDAVLATYIATE